MADSLNTRRVDSSRGEVDVLEGKKGSEFMKVSNEVLGVLDGCTAGFGKSYSAKLFDQGFGGMKGESPISCGQSGKTVTNPSSFVESMEAFREKLNVMKANVSGVNHEDLTPLFQEEILTPAAALNLLKSRWSDIVEKEGSEEAVLNRFRYLPDSLIIAMARNMVSNLDESEIVFEDITSQKLSDPKMGMDRVSPKPRSSSHREDQVVRNVFPQIGGHTGLQQGIRGERGGRGVGQRTGFLVNQSEQGEGNDAVNSVPVANPVVPEKKTWASMLATNQRSAVKLRYFPPDSNTDIVVDLPPREYIEKWEACLVGHFLDRNLNFNYVKTYAFNLWRRKGLREVISNNNGVPINS